jgi:subtilase family serine protease
MGLRSAGLLLLALLIVALLLAGCGGAGTPSIGGTATTTSAPTVASAAAATTAADKAALHGPPAKWEGHPPIHVHRNQATAPVGYSPAKVRHAYGFDALAGSGSGQTIAIVDAYGSPTIQKDLNTFCTQYGLAATTVTIASPGGKVTTTNAGWALETSLDVEWAHAIAPGASILLVVAKSASFTDLLTAVDYGAAHASQVSMSWGGGEFSGETGYDTHFNKTGVTFTCSSGDSGGGAQWPASSSYVTAVGGTTLNLDSSGSITSETGWSGSNGGPSAYISVPGYQSGWQTTGKRTMPDVSLIADPNTGVAVYDSTKYQGNSGWWEVGGTSAGAPMWAALFAVANGSRNTPLTATNMAVYGIVTPSSFTTDYRDIVTGSNSGYKAGPGYDMVTGIGTPKAVAAIGALGGYTPAVVVASSK